MKPGPIALILILLCCLVTTGCESIPLQDPLPPYVPQNYRGEAKLPETVRRVVLMPVAGASDIGSETLRELDAVMLKALQKQNRFEVVQLSRDECRRRYGHEALNSSAALPTDLMEQLSKHYAAEALLFVDLTVHQPYRPQVLGLRSKLALASDVHLLWTFDEVVSAENPLVAASVRQHFQRLREPVDLSPVALQSPSRFATFVAETMFGTLPPR
jgi:hypothetical protein